MHLTAGSDVLALGCSSGDSCNVNIDSLAVTLTTARYPTGLGSWRRSLDGQSGPAPTAPGLLSRAGRQLLDDTGTPLLSADGETLTQRPQHGHQP
ncbi:hypothetical protein ACFXO2_36425 [Streptomyces sp. NPDC059152]|uniref:hypothetical protein n=1 Tax=Streptomyces sp. NPDC059152 TaxID=3346742 RepID=UPI003678CE02